MGTYGPYPYRSSAAISEVTEQADDCSLISRCGNNKLNAVANGEVIINGQAFPFSLKTNAILKVLGPNFKSKDGYYIVSNDNIIMNVKEG